MEALTYLHLQMQLEGKGIVNERLMNAGKVPFYSHKVENVASASLARKLGLQPVFEEISIAQV